MTTQSLILLVLFLVVLLALAYPLGIVLARVGDGGKVPGLSWLGGLERLIYRAAGTTADAAQGWKAYAIGLLVFNAVGALAVYGVQRLQQWLPLNPQALANVSPDSAFNTAVSFVSNTNWQGYSGEQTMSYLTQALVLTGQNFFSAATGMAVAFALIRGFSARSSKSIGNFWVDVTRSTLYVLLPLSLLFSIFLMGQGVIQNFSAYKDVALLDQVSYSAPKNGPDGQPLMDAAGKPVTEDLVAKTQTIAMGPVASQEAIKMLGTNGGGFFNANSAHPFENPTPLTNLLQMLAIFLIPAGLTVTLGNMTRSPRHGWAVFAAMSVLFLAGVLTTYWAEAHPISLLHASHMPVQSGGNMEGKEVRFGIVNSALFATVTTDASCGAINSMHDSFTPLGGMVPLVNILLGEVIFGGVGAGMYGMLIFVILSVFIAGLMVGRTPEYLGKKIEAYDIQMAMLYLLIFPLVILGFSAVSVLAPTFGLSSLANHGPHGLSEILYAYTSATGNNGSAFAGLNANTTWYNTTLGIAMFVGRFLMLIPMLAIAGNLAQKKSVPENAGTFPVTTPLFTTLLIGVIVIVGALTFFPVLALGPILEHLLMQAGNTF
jgi:K+-transporting ATPase ATPase A chain